MGEQSTLRWEQDADGDVVITFDDPRGPVNVLNDLHHESFAAAVERLVAERDSVRGVILTSAKSTFFAGADLDVLVQWGPEDTKEIARVTRLAKDTLRRLETLGRPVVAAINGAALGGGLEICLACHRRVIVDDPRAVLGAPEVTFGLLPGAGGTVRAVRMLGIDTALRELLLDGRRLKPAKALELGLVDEVVATREDLLPAAKAWIGAQAGTDPVTQPWEAKGYKIPGGTPADPRLAATLPAMPALLRKRLKGANYPAPHHILAAAVESAQVDVDTALDIETRYFVDLAARRESTNMVQAGFFDAREVAGRATAGDAPPVGRAVVLGAGLMGAGIAYACARSGIEVVLKDVDRAAAERGKDHARRLVEQSVARGRTTEAAGQALLDRIRPTADAADAAGAELVIEAVFEDPAVKTRALQEIEPHLADGALVGSNTSTLPITGLAEGVARPDTFVGLHFFSPVDKMPLLEIVRGEQTSQATVDRALALAGRLGKTPIVVRDSRGFFTSRVIGTRIHEGVGMLIEGIPPATIEQASLQAGYPVPLLQLSDELNLNLMREIKRQYAAATDGPQEREAIVEVLDHMLEVAGDRRGRVVGRGFYDYDEDGRRTGLWPGLTEAFPPVPDPAALRLRDLVDRLLFREALEAVRCLDEGVIGTVAEANIGSLSGIGYPGWTGGVLQIIDGHEGGPRGFVERAEELAERYGPRFAAPASLAAAAERGVPFRSLAGERLVDAHA